MTKTELILTIQELKEQNRLELNDRTLCARVLYDCLKQNRLWNNRYSTRWPWIENNDYIEKFE